MYLSNYQLYLFHWCDISNVRISLSSSCHSVLYQSIVKFSSYFHVRFVYQDLSSTKVDAKVIFPHTDMDVRGFLSGPCTSSHVYDLHSTVCHFGGANGGHYTCFSRHPLSDQWYYYNDETVTEQIPSEAEYSSGYLLFYQKKGTLILCSCIYPSFVLMLLDNVLKTEVQLRLTTSWFCCLVDLVIFLTFSGKILVQPGTECTLYFVQGAVCCNLVLCILCVIISCNSN